MQCTNFAPREQATLRAISISRLGLFGRSVSEHVPRGEESRERSNDVVTSSGRMIDKSQGGRPTHSAGRRSPQEV